MTGVTTAGQDSATSTHRSGELSGAKQFLLSQMKLLVAQRTTIPESRQLLKEGRDAHLGVRRL